MAQILILEDEPTLADLFGRFLECKGHACDVAADGAEGSTLVYDVTKEYDLVLCELKMPQMNGKDFLQSTHPVLQGRTPFLMITTSQRAREGLGVARRWVFEIVEKPVRFEELNEAVDRALEQRALYLRLRELELRVQRLVENKDVLLEQRQALYDEVRVDAMTELPNRKRLEEELDIHLANVTRRRTRFAVAYCELDHFGRINRQMGYGASDAALRAVAERLVAAAHQGDTVYRYGDDKFVILFAHQDIHEACQAADSFRRALDNEEFELGAGMGATHLTLSGGVVAVTPESPRLPSEILGEASRLCLEAGASGGNQICRCSKQED